MKKCIICDKKVDETSCIPDIIIINEKIICGDCARSIKEEITERDD